MRIIRSCSAIALTVVLALTTGCVDRADSQQTTPPPSAGSERATEEQSTPPHDTTAPESRATTPIAAGASCPPSLVTSCDPPTATDACRVERDWIAGWSESVAKGGMPKLLTWFDTGKDAATIRVKELSANCYCVQFPRSAEPAVIGSAFQLPGGQLADGNVAIAGTIIDKATPYTLQIGVHVDLLGCAAGDATGSGSVYYKKDASGDSGGTWGGGK
jgi:hypothetical protein